MVAVLMSHCNLDWATTIVETLIAKARASKRPVRSRPMTTRAMPAFSRKQVSELATRYQAGASTYALANSYGVRRSTITSYLKKAGVEIRPGSQKALDFSAQVEVVRLYGLGLSIRSIGRRMDVSDNTILKVLNSKGVETRTRRGGRKKK